MICDIQTMLLKISTVLLWMLTDVVEANTTKDVVEAYLPYIVLIAGSSIVVLVVIVAICGGCTPMEVGSDYHAASGGHKSDTQYSSVVTDPGMQVMSAGTSFPAERYNPADNQLPYDPHPQTTHNFTGYNSQTISQPGYVALPGQQQGYQSSPAGANRSYESQESPPPSYNEAIQPSAPNQGQVTGRSSQQGPYGW